MIAAVLHGKENIRVENVVPRSLQAGEVRIQIEAALTCGTDLKVFKRGYHARMLIPPTVFGHEFAGMISELAPDVTGWRVGDRVAVANSAPCGKCFYCLNHQENLCDDLLFLNGAYAKSIVIPARVVQKNLLRLKPETAFCDAALVEPLACVVQGIEDTQLRSGQRVLVIGAGPIGLMFVALARHLGCQVTVAGRGKKRLETARRLGAELVLNESERGGLEAAIPPGSIFDVVIEAVGKPETWEAAVRRVRKGGTVNFFGGCPNDSRITLDTSLLHYSEITCKASFHHTPAYIRKALALVCAGHITASVFVNKEEPLANLLEAMRHRAALRSDQA